MVAVMVVPNSPNTSKPDEEGELWRCGATTGASRRGHVGGISQGHPTYYFRGIGGERNMAERGGWVQ
jgi:hypothetical protein